MSYQHFNSVQPDGESDGSTTLQQVRGNLVAMRDMLLAGVIPHWQSQNIITNGDVTMTTMTSADERLRLDHQYGSQGSPAEGLPVKTTIDYSSDAGLTWHRVGTQGYQYTADGDPLSTTWSNN